MLLVQLGLHSCVFSCQKYIEKNKIGSLSKNIFRRMLEICLKYHNGLEESNADFEGELITYLSIALK